MRDYQLLGSVFGGVAMALAIGFVPPLSGGMYVNGLNRSEIDFTNTSKKPVR